MSSLMDTNVEGRAEKEDGKIYTKYITNSMLDTFANDVKSNNLTKFKEYLETTDNISNYANAIQYSYDFEFKFI